MELQQLVVIIKMENKLSYSMANVSLFVVKVNLDRIQLVNPVKMVRLVALD